MYTQVIKIFKNPLFIHNFPQFHPKKTVLLSKIIHSMSQNHTTKRRKTIHKPSSETKTRPTVAWWKEECEREERIVRAEYRNVNETQQTQLN